MSAKKLVALIVAAAMVTVIAPAAAVGASRSDARRAGSKSGEFSAAGVSRSAGQWRPQVAKPAGSVHAQSRVLSKVILPDVYELPPGDDTTATAKPLQFGVTENHSIDATSGHAYPWGDGPDTDWHVLDATPGTLYTFETTGAADTVLEIWNEHYGEMYAWNDDRDILHGDMGSKITWTAPDDPDAGLYYVVVEPANFVNGTGGYDFTATAEADSQVTANLKRIPSSPISDRYSAAEELAHEAFPAWTYFDQDANVRSVCATVIVCNGDDAKAADPLAASSLAGVYHAPIVFTKPLAIPKNTTRVINGVKAANGGKVNIVVIGGTGSVPLTVYNGLAKLRGTGTISRISGLTRYDVAGLIADKVSDWWMKTYGKQPYRVFVGNGQNAAAFYDALVAGPAMYHNRAPLLLTKDTGVPSQTRGRIIAHYADVNRTRVTVLNAYYLPPTYWGQLGASQLYLCAWEKGRDWAAYEIDSYMLGAWLMPGEKIAVTNKLSDSLAGGAAMGELGGQMLYTGVNVFPDAGWIYMDNRRSSFQQVYVFGGTGSVGLGVWNDIPGATN